MNELQLKMCDVQGRLFELSADRKYSSSAFIKAFMLSPVAKSLDSKFNHMQWAGEEYLLEEVIDEAGDRFEKLGEVYAEELIYWIGYIYRYWHYMTGESSKEIYKQVPVKVMKQNYARLCMMTPEEVIEKLIEKN